jgi:putative ABC transport system permease protein
LRRWNPAFESLAGFRALELNLTGTDNAERLRAEVVTAEYFPTLGIAPALGRWFLPEEDRTQGTHPVVVIADGFWKRRLGANRSAIGGTIHLDRMPFTIVGVMPPGFRGLTGNTDVWAPMMMAPALYGNPRRLQTPNAFWLQAVGRLKKGVSVDGAAAALRAIEPELEKAHPSPRQTPIRTSVKSLLDAKIDPGIRRSLLILFGAVGFVLLIACANLANLLLGRAVARQKEIAVRLALGAGRWALIRQFLAESTVLAVLGGIAGLFIATWGLDVLTTMRPETARRGMWTSYARLVDRDSVGLDAWVLVFTLAISIAAGILFGLLPAWQASRARISETLKSGAGRIAWRFGELRRINPRSLLIAGETALALVLLAGAGLMIASLRNLWNRPLGVDGGHVLTFRLDLPQKQYTREAAAQFFERLLARIEAVPGVNGASVANALPVTGQTEVTVVGPGQEEPSRPIGVHFVAPEYFSVFRIPLIRGRLLSANDRPGQPRAAVLSETTARGLFPDSDAVGQTIRDSDGPIEIVGVAGDVVYDEPDGPARFDMYLSYRQEGYGSTYVVVRSTGEPGALVPTVRSILREMDRDVPMFGIRSMQERISDASSSTRFSASVLTAFAILALVLAAVGLYGVTSDSVAARTREIGIRMALGARPGDVMRDVLRDGMLVVLAGSAVGVPAALFATRVLQTVLYGVKPADPATLVLITLLLAAVTLAATYFPARAALRVDPMTALRQE